MGRAMNTEEIGRQPGVRGHVDPVPVALLFVDDQQAGKIGARLGLVECMKHELLHEYPVLYEKPGDAVAHFKATVLVMKNGNDRITTWTSQPIQSDLELTDALRCVNVQ